MWQVKRTCLPRSDAVGTGRGRSSGAMTSMRTSGSRSSAARLAACTGRATSMSSVGAVIGDPRRVWGSREEHLAGHAVELAAAAHERIAVLELVGEDDAEARRLRRRDAAIAQDQR